MLHTPPLCSLSIHKVRRHLKDWRMSDEDWFDTGVSTLCWSDRARDESLGNPLDQNYSQRTDCS